MPPMPCPNESDKMSNPKPFAFVAYPSNDDALIGTLQAAIFRANAVAAPVRYEPWIFNDIPGVPLISPIASQIEDSSFALQISHTTTVRLNDPRWSQDSIAVRV